MAWDDHDMILIDGNSKEPVTDDLLHLNNNHLLGFDETEPQIILWAPLQQTVDFICCVLVLVCFFFSGGEGPHPFAYLHPGSDFFAGGGGGGGGELILWGLVFGA